MLIDNPGMREVGLWAAEAGVGETFDDVASLAGGCRFDDCRHDSEPGCAVQAAVQRGELRQERLTSFRKLASELRRPRRHGRQGGRPGADDRPLTSVDAIAFLVREGCG